VKEKFPSFGGVAKFSKENFDGVVNLKLSTSELATI